MYGSQSELLTKGVDLKQLLGLMKLGEEEEAQLCVKGKADDGITHIA